ncbi:MAG: hypothetical protein HKN08_05975, partial [Gammaproteobacteria bacterium]|nr:hypothetical protein [Gammaproteobacteria bacterium]
MFKLPVPGHTSGIQFTLFIILTVIFNFPAMSQQGCPLLDQYMAPFETPVSDWPEAMAGPAPGDVEQRLVGPNECRIVAEKIIHNAEGTPY